MAVVMIWSPSPRCEKAAPFTAQLSDSVPPAVKKISSGDAPRARATCSRAPSTARLDSRAMEYRAEGLPNRSWK